MNVLINERTQSVVFQHEDPLRIRSLIPAKSRLIDHPDYNLQVQHTIESTIFLRNMGIDVPSPILAQYNWPGKYKPFDHQRTMADFLTLNPRCFNLSEMGTGKTAATLWASDFLMNIGEVGKALILSPLSTVDCVWQRDIFDVLMHRKAVILHHGDRQRRLDMLEADVDFYILNHDGVKITQLREMLRKRKDINLIIVDEGSMFRNASSDKYKMLIKLIRSDQRVWWMTGTPCPNQPTDAWAQARVINPGKVPQFFGAFQRATMTKVSEFKWAPKPDSAAKAFEALQPAIRFLKKDCMTLPPVVTMPRQADLTPEQKKAFNSMRTVMQLEAKSTAISAVNAADKINKLRQILCGVIKDPTSGDYIPIPHGPRLATLLETIEQASAKVLVVVPFKGIIQALEKEVSKHYSVGVLNGDVSPKARDRIVNAFKTTADPHVLLCHPKVMAHGLNLTEADLLIFYAPIYSNDETEQVNERFNRAGQTRKMTIVRLGAHPLEWDIYRAVDERRDGQNNILSMYRHLIN